METYSVGRFAQKFRLRARIVDDVPDADRWNYNTNYYRIAHRAMRAGTESVLDVGCGEGMLTRQLARRISRVVGVDPDAESIEAARKQSADIEYICGDLFDYPFEPSSFDAVVSFAVLHHMDAERGLERMAELVRPGGTVVVVGCAGSERPRDLPMDAASTVAALVAVARHKLWRQPSPIVWPPPDSYRMMREHAARLLPGSRFRRHLLFRYSIVWTRPASRQMV